MVIELLNIIDLEENWIKININIGICVRRIFGVLILTYFSYRERTEGYNILKITDYYGIAKF